jgi:single-strand DNA-binding protein
MRRRKKHSAVPNFNRIILAGNLVRDPDLRYVQSGAPVTTFTLAVNRRGKAGESVDYIDIVAWHKLAETSNTYLRRGMPVLVEGRLAVRSYESKGGEKHRAAEVVLSALQLLVPATNDRSQPAVDEVESEPGAVA